MFITQRLSFERNIMIYDDTQVVRFEVYSDVMDTVDAG